MLTSDDMSSWAVNMVQCYPTIKNLDSESDVAYWERLMGHELNETVLDPDEVSLAIIWSKKAIDRDPYAGPPTPIDLADWIRKRRKHLKDKDHWSHNEKKVDDIIEEMRAMAPSKRYEKICAMEPRLASVVGPIVEALPGGLGEAPSEIARSLKRFLATIGTSQEPKDVGYQILDGGEMLEEADEYYDAKTDRWFVLGQNAFDPGGHRKRYVKYRNTRIRRLVQDAGKVAGHAERRA